MPVLSMTKEDFKTKIFDYENDENWNYQEALPAVIDFYADWCAPCKILSPVLEELSEELAEKVLFYKINTDAEPALSALFGIRSVPTLLFIPIHSDPFMEQGALPKYMLKDLINDTLLSNNATLYNES